MRICVICTALPVEYRAVREHLANVNTCSDDDGTVFEQGLFEGKNGTWQVGLVETGAGNIPAALITQNAIKYFVPEIVLFVGVAGGIKDVGIGDIVIATKVYEYARGKSTSTGFLLRPDVRYPGFRMLEQAKVVSRSDAWQSRLGTASVSNKAYLGPIAAGEAVIASRDGTMFKHIQNYCSDALAVEMEGSGFLSAAYISRNDALIIRGVSDLLGNKARADASGSQQLASKHAAAFAFELVSQLEGKAPVVGKRDSRTSKGRNRGVARDGRMVTLPPGSERSYETAAESEYGIVTIVRDRYNKARLESVIGGQDWIVGAVNFDEDLHFSSFYTRQSCVPYLKRELSVFGYVGLIAVYEDFRESYYIPRTECVRVAQAILDRLLQNPIWMQEILEQIYSRSKALQDVFSDDLVPFDQLSDLEVWRIYRRHNRVHSHLYEVARIPEAMDRGVALFTGYLKGYLKRRGALLANSPKELNRVFEVLTFPEEMSAVKREMGEFHELLEAIKKSTEAVSVLSSGGRRAWLKMPPALRIQIEKHRKKWGYLGYHGYGTRTLPDLDHYLHRMTATLSHSGQGLSTTAEYTRVLADAEKRRIEEFRMHRIDETHQMLFRLHSRIGIAKLFRRYSQLRNFAYLDQLLSDISRRKGCPEDIVRCMLPEEVESLLLSKTGINSVLQARTDFVAHIIDREAELVLGGKDFLWVRERLAEKSRTRPVSSTRLEGTPVYSGVVRGPCKIIVRLADAERVHFRPGDILVSESTDPDLVPLMHECSGVATEQGGVTSHAAIVCRELGKPALVGVGDLLSVVKNDDYAVLNAEEGYLSILRWEQRRWTLPDARVEDKDLPRIGAKAFNLAKMLKGGIKVPRFFIVPLDTISNEILTAVRDATGEYWEALRTELSESLEYLNGDLFVVRTSVLGEDAPDRSFAGQFETESHVERRDVVARVIKQILTSSVGSTGLSGSIIVQEMILGDFSGICFTRNPTDPKSDDMLVEAVPGGNDALTSGKVVPARYKVDRNTFMITWDETSHPWRNVLSPTLWNKLARSFIVVEQMFGCPQDMEWTVKGNDLWMLQARPITAYASDEVKGEPTSYRRRTAIGPRDISSVYSAYRVPPNLRLHMLRVASVASMICDNWLGPPLEANAIILTSLLHDIGNIAKANYDSFPTLFPEEMQDLQYWKTVQDHIRTRYGGNDQEVTLNIARELGVGDHVLSLLERKTFLQNESTAAGADWSLKICAYADQRVGPTGVMTLADRLAEARERYRGVPYASVNDPRFPRLAHVAGEIEDQISVHLRIRPDDITDAKIAPYMDALRTFVV